MTTQPRAVNGEIQRRLAATAGETAAPTADTKSNLDGGGDAACATCPHRWSSHDQIAARYCTATATSGHSRGCVCTGKEIQ